MQKRLDILAAENYAIPYVVTRHSILAARERHGLGKQCAERPDTIYRCDLCSGSPGIGHEPESGDHNDFRTSGEISIRNCKELQERNPDTQEHRMMISARALQREKQYCRMAIALFNK